MTQSKNDQGKQVTDGEQPSEAETPALDEDLQDFLGKKLQSHYQGLVSEPLPERFATLLSRLTEPQNGPVQKVDNDGTKLTREER